MDTSFVHDYECEQLEEMPGYAPLPHYYYPGASTEGGRDGILVMVRPACGQTWYGTFAFDQIAGKGVSGIFTTPDPQRVCVVAKGAGYLVATGAPASWEPVCVLPIIDVRPVHTHGLLVFASLTELVAYGQQGIKWETKRLTWDEMRITEVAREYIKGEFWDIRTEAMADFTVDLATGTHRGGIGP